MLNGVPINGLRRGTRTSESARTLLGLIRLANGTGSLIAPDLFARRLGVEPEANPAASYVTRLFGIRTMVIGYELLQRDEETRRRALRVATLIHASDTVAAMVAGGTGRPRRSQPRSRPRTRCSHWSRGAATARGVP